MYILYDLFEGLHPSETWYILHDNIIGDPRSYFYMGK
jgi:hypothetical protein